MSVTIRDTMTDSALFGNQFSGDSWAAWRALLAGFYGLEMDTTEADHWHALTGRDEPTQPHDELWLVVGRRGGKSQCAALLAVYEAAFRDHQDKLSPGEVATVAVLAADRKQARTVFRYVSGLLRSNPMTEQLIVREDREAIELANRTAIEITTASFRSTRGYTFAMVIADEIAYWRDLDSANPDSEIINAVRPGLATLGGPLVALSSPYSKKGELYQHHRRYYAQESNILVAQASSRYMNPELPARVVNEAFERDPESAKAEYGGDNGAEFRSDLESFISPEVVDQCTAVGRYELPPMRSTQYRAFTDPAGGSGQDAMTLAIAHQERGQVVLDCVRAAQPPFSPEQVVADFAEVCKTYGCTTVTGDRYGGEYPRELFRNAGVRYELSDRTASDYFRDLLPLLNSGRVELLENRQLRRELINLERRTSRNGKDSISHPSGGHDDLINAAAAAVVTANDKPARDWAAMLGD